MKQLSLMSIILTLSLGLVRAQGLDVATTSMASTVDIEFVKAVHDFGTVEKGVPVEASFPFQNIGQAPLVITKVVGSCGCTVTDYTKEPILPGDKGWVKATYNAAKSGAFNKSITVTTNAKLNPFTLFIKGVVK